MSLFDLAEAMRQLQRCECFSLGLICGKPAYYEIRNRKQEDRYACQEHGDQIIGQRYAVKEIISTRILG